MDEELDEKLCSKYPLIFADRHRSVMETAMCWGFECGNGWYDLIDTLCDTIQHHIDCRKRQREVMLSKIHGDIPEEIPQVVAEQVKEKFGRLRFYYRGGDEYIIALIWYEFLTRILTTILGILFIFIGVLSPDAAYDAMRKALKDY